MKIQFGRQISISEIDENEIDLFLFANNNEERKLSALNILKTKITINRIYSFKYKNSNECELQNVLNITIEDHSQIIKLLDNEVMNNSKEEITIFVDYSCMTKAWYYTIILYLSNKKLSQKSITVYFNYTPSIFSDPLKPKPNTDISPLPGKYIIPNNKPKALIVGLGYEENKAQGIIDQLDPAKTFLFYTDPALDKDFVNAIKNNNKTILKEFKDSTVKYRFNNLLDLERKLTSIYFQLKDEYNIIIAPLGPKPFTYVSMILSIIFKDIEIWRVGSGEDINPYPRKPFDTDEFILSKVIFE